MSINLGKLRDPIYYLIDQFFNYEVTAQEKPILEIFSYLNIADWGNCCLVSKPWKERLISDKCHPLLIAIRTNQVEAVKRLLQQGASAKLRMNRSHLTETVNCTPYIYAQECNYHEIASLLKDSDGNFTENYIKNKRLTLQFELGGFNLEGHAFSDGLDHFVHHQYLVKWMIDSLKQFLAEYKSENWNSEKTQRLISLLETSSCTSCHTEQSKADQYEKNKGSLFLSDTSVFDHRHWINIVLMDSPWIIVGNRGMGSIIPGTRFIKPESPFHSFSAFVAIYYPESTTRYSFDLELPGQRSGSCAMTSFEAGIMGALFAMMIEDSTSSTRTRKAKGEAKSIFNAWRKESQISLLKQIIVEDGEGYDPSALTQALGRFDACEQTAQCFCDFLLSKGIIPWKDGLALGYAFRKNDAFLHLVAKNIKGEEAHSFLKNCLNLGKYSVAEGLYKNRIPLIVHRSSINTRPTSIAITYKISPRHRLFIRGSGNGLSWEKGCPLTRYDDSTWLYGSPFPLEDMEYKFLINDSIWQEGDNYKIINGKITETIAHFILPPSISSDTLEKDFSTMHCFWSLHEKNIKFKANIRGMVNDEYNRLLRQNGLTDHCIPGGENLELLGLDQDTSIVRPDLYYQSYKKAISPYHIYDSIELTISTSHFFDLLHQENVKYSSNIRELVNQRYNQLLLDNGDNNYDLILGDMDKTTSLQADLYFRAYEEILSPFNK